MLTNLEPIFKDAERNHYAIGSFNCPNYETAKAAVMVSEKLGVPVILNHGEGHEAITKMEDIAPILLHMARTAKNPICVHIDHGDHGTSDGFLLRAIRAGFTSIMCDGSKLPFEENVERVKEFVKKVHPIGISVEAELGSMLNNIPGFKGNDSDDTLDNVSKTFTDPIKAGEFVRKTGVDALAVSFGSMHGTYKKPPKLNIELLDKIHTECGNTALVMHGSSGIDFDQVKCSIRHGIRKLNYYTMISTAPAEKIKEFIDKGERGNVFFHDISNIAIDVMYKEILSIAEAIYNPGR